jgi:hypothetical protein
MHRIGALALLAAAALTGAAASSSASAATWLAVGPNKDLCGEKGCFEGQTKIFTRTFTAAEHGGGQITSLSLFRSVLGEMANHNVKIVFELPDGTEVTWGRWTVGAMAGDQFVTIGGEAIDWDAALGDLKVRLELFKPEKGGPNGVAWGWGAGGSDNALGGGGGGGGGGGSGVSLAAPQLPFGELVNSGPLAPPLPAAQIVGVPEPGAWALMIMGFGMTGALVRRRRRAVLRLQPQR